MDAKKNYRKKTRQVAIEFNMDKESDLYNFLSSKGNKQGYIKELLRKALEKSTPLEKEINEHDTHKRLNGC